MPKSKPVGMFLGQVDFRPSAWKLYTGKYFFHLPNCKFPPCKLARPAI